MLGAIQDNRNRKYEIMNRILHFNHWNRAEIVDMNKVYDGVYSALKFKFSNHIPTQLSVGR